MTIEEFRRLYDWLDRHGDSIALYLFFTLCTGILFGVIGAMLDPGNALLIVGLGIAPSLTPPVLLALNYPIMRVRTREARKINTLETRKKEIARMERELLDS